MKYCHRTTNTHTHIHTIKIANPVLVEVYSNTQQECTLKVRKKKHTALWKYQLETDTQNQNKRNTTTRRSECGIMLWKLSTSFQWHLLQVRTQV